jgi:flagellar basal body rod protein FlgG
MDILPIAATALNAAGTATAVRAQNIANFSNETYQAAEPVYGSLPNGGGVAVLVQNTDQPVDLVREIIGLRSALYQYQSAAALVETGSELNKTLIDSIA